MAPTMLDIRTDYDSPTQTAAAYRRKYNPKRPTLTQRAIATMLRRNPTMTAQQARQAVEEMA